MKEKKSPRKMRFIHQEDEGIKKALSNSLSDLNTVNDGNLCTIDVMDISLDENNARRYKKVSPDEIFAHLSGDIDLSKKKDTLEFFNGISELSKSIEKEGLVQPISVSEDNGKFKIKSGERRYLAHLLLARESIRAIVRKPEKTRVASTVASLVENLQREDLSTGELILAICHLKDEYEKEGGALSGEKLATLLSKSPRTCQIYLQLINGQQDILDKIINNELTIKQARKVLIKEKKPKKEAFKEIKLGKIVHSDFSVIKKIANLANENGIVNVDVSIDWNEAAEVEAFWKDFLSKMSVELNSEN